MRIPQVDIALPVKVLLVAALVAVLLPACAMQLCGPADGMPMGYGIAGMLDCGEMYYPSDAPSALVLAVFALLFVTVLFWNTDRSPSDMHAAAVCAAGYREDPPEPPDDPLAGRLII